MEHHAELKLKELVEKFASGRSKSDLDEIYLWKDITQFFDDRQRFCICVVCGEEEESDDDC